ncbi:hypothetical protein DTO282E5_4628 [Paecilomyces variotii]|nr:hypothetical protein DTO282E5_4628 [Paecilomyces variotii]
MITTGGEKSVEGNIDLGLFLGRQKKDPEEIDDITVVICLLTDVLAERDSTTITITAVLYYILKNPEVHSKLCISCCNTLFLMEGFLSLSYGQFVTGGTVIDMNLWVNCSESVFGNGPNRFILERRLPGPG